jgi:hypothetical protein
LRPGQEAAAGVPYTVILLLSAQHVVRAETRLLEASIACKLIPVPRQVSSECGVCLRVATADREAALQYLESLGIEVVGSHELGDR